MKPFISIIIPIYNVAQYLRECLDSVLAQTFGDWEAICVDDGSTDGSSAILDEYAAKDKRFRIIHQANAGVSAARNAALDAARGDYVTFVDGDDAIDKRWLEVAKEEIDSKAPDLLRMKLMYFDRGKFHDEEGFPNPVHLTDRREILRWGWKNLLRGGWSCLFFVKRALVEPEGGVRFPVGMRIREDLVFLLNLLLRADTLVQNDFAGYHYCIHGSSAYFSGRRDIADSIAFAAALLACWDETKGAFPDFDDSGIRREVSKCVWGSVVEWVCHCDPREWKRDKEYLAVLHRLDQAGLLRGGDLSGRWRVAKFAYGVTGSLGGFYFIKRLANALKGAKK